MEAGWNGPFEPNDGSRVLSDRAVSLPTLHDSRSSFEEKFSVNSLREARKRAEQDEKALVNRILLLRHEGEKTCKRIEDTRMRTRELIETKAQMVPAQDPKEVLRVRQEEIQLKQAQNAQAREHGKLVRESIRNALTEHRRQNAKRLREGSRNMKESKREVDAVQRQLLEDRVNTVRAYVVGDEKRRLRDEARLAQLEQNRQEYFSRGHREAKRRADSRARILQLEQQEMALVQWCQAKQAEQYDAYQELAGAVGKPTRGHGRSQDDS